MKNLIKKILSVRNRRKTLRFLNKLWRKICSLLPLRNVVLFYSVRADGQLLENARAVYDKLDAKKIIFAHKLPHSVRIKPLAYYYLMTSKVIVTDDYVRYMRVIKLRKNQKLIQIWHACGAFKKFGLDAPSQLTPEEEKSTHSQYSAVVVTSEKCREKYAGAFGISKEVCLPLGLPRTDNLIKSAPEMRKNIFEKYPALQNKKIYLYCPTFREADGKRIEYNPGIDFGNLSESMHGDEVFIIRRHPLMDYRFENGGYPNILDLSNESTLWLTAACDAIITDYSSVIYDAALLDKPMVFYCPDYEKYERGFYLDFPDGLPGEMTADGAELLDCIRRTVKNPPSEKIARFKNEQLSACDGNCTERVVALIKKWLNYTKNA